MSKLLAVGGVVLLIAAQAGASTAIYESFNGTYTGGPVGPTPAGWTYFGYGPPAYTSQQTGIVEAPNDGTNSSWQVSVPGSVGGTASPKGTIAIYKTGVKLDSLTLPGETIDWTQPVYLKADVYGADYSFDKTFKTTLSMQGYTRTEGVAEWGADGVGNAHWETLTTTISPNQAGKSGNLILFLDFDFTGSSFPEVSTVMWENVRLDYTPTPEPASLLLVGSLLGLVLVRRPR